MKLEYAKLIAEAAHAMDRDLDVELRHGYSGRGMYGSTTTALVASDIPAFAAAACEVVARLTRDGDGTSRFIDAVRAVRTDSMGRDSVVIY